MKRVIRLVAMTATLPLAGLGATAAPAYATCEFPRGVSIGDVRAYEGTEARTTLFVFTVTTGGCTHPATVNYTTLNGGWFGGATAPVDFAARSGTLSWAAGDDSDRTIAISVATDDTDELNESFFVKLSGATDYISIDADTGTGTILDDDGPISWNIDDASCVEGDPGDSVTYYRYCFFTVHVPPAQATGEKIHVKTLAGGTATAGTDYVAIADQILTIQGNSVSGYVKVKKDQDCEGDEYLKVALVLPSVGVQGDSIAKITIQEDDMFCDLSELEDPPARVQNSAG